MDSELLDSGFDFSLSQATQLCFLMTVSLALIGSVLQIKYVKGIFSTNPGSVFS